VELIVAKCKISGLKLQEIYALERIRWLSGKFMTLDWKYSENFHRRKEFWGLLHYIGYDEKRETLLISAFFFTPLHVAPSIPVFVTSLLIPELSQCDFSYLPAIVGKPRGTTPPLIRLSISELPPIPQSQKHGSKRRTPILLCSGKPYGRFPLAQTAARNIRTGSPSDLFASAICRLKTNNLSRYPSRYPFPYSCLS